MTAALAGRVYDLREAGRREEAAAAQERLAGIRSTIDAHPTTIPVLKAIMRELTGDDGWLRLSPPFAHSDPGVACGPAPHERAAVHGVRG